MSPLVIGNGKCVHGNSYYKRYCTLQIVRHRSFAFRNPAQRYAESSEMGGMFVHREARMQDPKNRQNSVDTEDERLQMIWASLPNKVMREAQEAYEWALENGIAQEQARVVLTKDLQKLSCI